MGDFDCCTVNCKHGHNTCAPVHADCCNRPRSSCQTTFVPEAGNYCSDGYGCNR